MFSRISIPFFCALQFACFFWQSQSVGWLMSGCWYQQGVGWERTVPYFLLSLICLLFWHREFHTHSTLYRALHMKLERAVWHERCVGTMLDSGIAVLRPRKRTQKITKWSTAVFGTIMTEKQLGNTRTLTMPTMRTDRNTFEAEILYN